MTERKRRPAAFRIGDPDVTLSGPGESEPGFVRPGRAVITPAPDQPEADAFEAAVAETTAKAPAAGIGWSGLLLSALGGLISLALGLWVDRLIRDLFARADWLGWLAVALALLVALAALGIAWRELRGLARLARIQHLRDAVAAVLASDDGKAGRAASRDLAQLYVDRPETARGRAALAGHAAEIIDGRDLMTLAERELLAPLDLAAKAMILEAAKRVSVVTAISPRAVVDLAYVLFENMRLLSGLATLYGGRPGRLGFVKLAGRVIAHLGITGGMAIGDQLIQQLVGQGVAARISARLGEGVVNGLLTARIGLASLDLVRPMPFTGLPRPAIGDIVAELTRLSGTKSEPA